MDELSTPLYIVVLLCGTLILCGILAILIATVHDLVLVYYPRYRLFKEMAERKKNYAAAIAGLEKLEHTPPRRRRVKSHPPRAYDTRARRARDREE